MSVFTVPIEIGNLERQRFERIAAWVDTGAGRIVASDIGHMWIRVGDRAEITLVLFAEPESESRLGAYTLEGLLNAERVPA